MTTASVTEFKANVSSYLRQVEAGEEVVITNHGEVSARVVAEGDAHQTGGMELVSKMTALRERLHQTLPQDDWNVQDYIRNGRK